MIIYNAIHAVFLDYFLFFRKRTHFIFLINKNNIYQKISKPLKASILLNFLKKILNI